MSTTEPRRETTPDPSALVAPVAQLVEGPWPRSGVEREGLFSRHRFTSGARFDQRSEGSLSASFALTNELPGDVFTSWDTYNGKFMGIHLHPYTFMEPAVPAARRGYEEVWTLLTGLYGPPTRPWEDEEVPPSIWKVNGCEIVTHFFGRRHSGMMLSISDAELSAAEEADARDDLPHPDSIDRPVGGSPSDI